MLVTRTLLSLLLATACAASCDSGTPPPDVDGGSHTFRYRFEAVAPGRAKVSFALTSPDSKDPIESVQFTVVVTEA